MISITAQTQCVGKSLTSGFPLPSLWQADTEATQAGKILLVTWPFHKDIKQKKGSMYQDRKNDPLFLQWKILCVTWWECLSFQIKSILPREHPMHSRHCWREMCPKEAQMFKRHFGASAPKSVFILESFSSILQTNINIVRERKGLVVLDAFGM